VWLRRVLKLQLITRYLMLAGLLPAEIKKEMHAAVDRAVFSRYHKKTCALSAWKGSGK